MTPVGLRPPSVTPRARISQRTNPGGGPLSLRGILRRPPEPALLSRDLKTVAKDPPASISPRSEPHNGGGLHRNGSSGRCDRRTEKRRIRAHARRCSHWLAIKLDLSRGILVIAICVLAKRRGILGVSDDMNDMTPSADASGAPADRKSLKACGYGRVSTTRQAEGELSLPEQSDAVARHCATRSWERSTITSTPASRGPKRIAGIPAHDRARARRRSTL